MQHLLYVSSLKPEKLFTTHERQLTNKVRKGDDEDSDGGEAVGDAEPERPLPDFAD